MKNVTIDSIKQTMDYRRISIDRVIEDKNLCDKLFYLIEIMIQCFEKGNKMILCGNGGSATDCQHIAGEFIVKLTNLRKSLPVISLTSNNAVVTAIANDFDFDYIFTRQLEGIAKQNDVLVGLSTSGNSKNVINAFEYANRNGIFTISVTGDTENELKSIAQEKIVIPSNNPQIIQELTLMVFHILCEKIDEYYNMIPFSS